MRKSLFAAIFLATTLAQSAPVLAHAGGETVRQTFSRSIPNVPGKSLVAVEVTYAPGGASRPYVPPTRHSCS